MHCLNAFTEIKIHHALKKRYEMLQWAKNAIKMVINAKRKCFIRMRPERLFCTLCIQSVPSESDLACMTLTTEELCK